MMCWFLRYFSLFHVVMFYLDFFYSSGYKAWGLANETKLYLKKKTIPVSLWSNKE